MQNNTEVQHFVPVCYLRNFSPESEKHKKNPRVWAYDKLSKSSRFRGAKSICYSRRLYSINNKSESLITNNIKDKETIFESHYLHDFENEYSIKLNEAIESIQQRKFVRQQKLDVSAFIAIQYLRDPILKFLCAEDEEIPYLSLPEEYKKLTKNSPELLADPSMRHFMYAYGNRNAVSTLIRSLAESEWTFHYSDKDVFFTSDNPVCLAQDKPSALNTNGVSNAPTLSILFPLSKNILLQVRQKRQTENIYFVDNTPQTHIDNFNFIQAFFAKKYIVSTTDSFTSIKRKLDAIPFTWDKNKLTIYE